jgi:hypothetical protein
MRDIIRLKQWMVVIVILGVLFHTGCCTLCPEKRALPIPSAASRSPDFNLPLSDYDQKLALLYLANVLPSLEPEEIEDEEMIAEYFKRVEWEIKQQFQAILDALSEKIPSKDDLKEKGSIGVLFSAKGADDVALDARFKGQIIPYDLCVGKLHGYYFVFYRRYPFENKDVSCDGNLYCRLVIVNEVSTRRY